MNKPLWTKLKYNNQEEAYLETIARIIQSTSENGMEHAAAVLDDGSVYEIEGEGGKILVYGEPKKVLRTSWNDTIIFIHSHIDGLLFSPADYYFMAKYPSIKQMTTVLSSGILHTLLVEKAHFDKDQVRKSAEVVYCSIYNRICAEAPLSSSLIAGPNASRGTLNVMTQTFPWKFKQEKYDMKTHTILEEPDVLTEHFEGTGREKYPIGNGMFLYEIKPEEQALLERMRPAIDKAMDELRKEWQKG